MQKKIDGWTITDERAESSYGLPVYVAASCQHGNAIAHSLQEAIACGLLRNVRAARDLSQEQAARQIPVALNTWARWERAEMLPAAGPVVVALEAWLLGDSSGAESGD